MNTSHGSFRAPTNHVYYVWQLSAILPDWLYGIYWRCPENGDWPCRTLALPDSKLPRQSKISVAYCCVINIIRRPDTPSQRTDRQALGTNSLGAAACTQQTANATEQKPQTTVALYWLFAFSFTFRAFLRTDIFAVVTLLRKLCMS